MDYLLTSKLIDSQEPEKSLLLRKPLGAVKHGGGIKILVGDQGYKALRAWIEDVSAIRGNRYIRASDLPPKEKGPIPFGSDIWLKLAETPPGWGDRLLQVSVYAWDSDKKVWEKEPIATSDRKVWGKGKQWQHNLTLLASKPARSAPQTGRKASRPFRQGVTSSRCMSIRRTSCPGIGRRGWRKRTIPVRWTPGPIGAKATAP